MATRHLRSLLSARIRPLFELFTATPATSFLLSVGPLALAVGQLLNGYVNGLSYLVSVPFAVVLLGFSVVAMRHHAAEHRLRRLKAEDGVGRDP